MLFGSQPFFLAFAGCAHSIRQYLEFYSKFQAAPPRPAPPFQLSSLVLLLFQFGFPRLRLVEQTLSTSLFARFHCFVSLFVCLFVCSFVSILIVFPASRKPSHNILWHRRCEYIKNNPKPKAQNTKTSLAGHSRAEAGQRALLSVVGQLTEPAASQVHSTTKLSYNHI